MKGKGRQPSPKEIGQSPSPEGWDAFVSHSSADDNLATRLEQGLEETGLRVWVDHADLRRRGLLLSALQEALLRCVHLVLLWSQAAEQSRYVTAEWNFAWNQEIPILPCRLDQTFLPLGLAGYLYCDFRADFDTGFSQLKEALQEITQNDRLFKARTLEGKTRQHAISCSKELSKLAFLPDYQKTLKELWAVQTPLLRALNKGRVETALHLQARLDPLLEAAVRTYPDDAYLIRTAGSVKEIAYQIKYRPQIQAQQFPPDPLLAEAEACFWKVLQILPNDSAALKGLGRVLRLRGDLDAAEFFAQCGSDLE